MELEAKDIAALIFFIPPGIFWIAIWIAMTVKAIWEIGSRK